MKVKEIKVVLGGDISTKNGKMPGSTFGLSTSGCNVGGKLRNVCGSTCEKCYAAKLEKLRPSVKQGWQNRTDAVNKACESVETMQQWIDAMAIRLQALAEKSGEFYHRWHDSGDLQSFDHLLMICEVARKTPQIKHWLPTREKALIRQYMQNGVFPENLTVRVSAAMIDAEPMQDIGNTSTVHRKTAGCVGHECPASKQGNSCGECRACWDKAVNNVSYPLH